MKPYEEIIPHSFAIRKLRLIEIKYFVQRHMASERVDLSSASKE